jgi:PncC family amidohydrolase
VDVAEEIGRQLTDRGETLAIAESLTGGLVGSMVTDVPGSSAYFLEGIVAYSNDAKMALLNVEEETLVRHGAVSKQVAREMARGVRKGAGAHWGIATTGIAGPTGDTPDKPIGLVYLAVCGRGRTVVRRKVFNGDRLEVKGASARAVLRLLLEELEEA